MAGLGAAVSMACVLAACGGDGVDNTADDVLATGSFSAPASDSTAAVELEAVDVVSSVGLDAVVETVGENCVADFDGDGMVDLLLSTHSAPWDLFYAVGDDSYRRSAVFELPDVDRHGCAVGDFNGDGRMDIYASVGACRGECEAPRELWIQGEGGTFDDRALEWGVADAGVRGRDPVVLDANADGLDDIFATAAKGVDFPSPNRLWLNNGSTFVASEGLPSEEVGSYSVDEGEIKGDGVDEIVLGSEDGLRIYLSNGTGGFDNVAGEVVPDWGRRDVALFDLDGDGWLDSVLTTEKRVDIYYGGLAGFGDRVSLDVVDARDVAIGDADGDGNADLFVVQLSNASVDDLLFLGLGADREFVPGPRIPSVGGNGDTAVAVPGYSNGRTAFVVNNGAGVEPGPRQLIVLRNPTP